MSEIILFKPAEDGSRPTETAYSRKKKRSRWECRHHSLVLDESTRLAECKNCGDALDPFDVLVEYAYGQRQTKFDIARWEAARAEFEAIEAGWNLIIAEKRRIKKAMDEAEHAVHVAEVKS